MDNTDYRITLDITDMSAPISLNVKQGDAGRSIEVHLSRDGVPVAIESGSYAVFAGKKPDGKVLWNSCTIQDNRILYEITKQTTAVIGWVPVQIRLYRPGGKLVTSPDFVLIVDGTVTEDDEVVIISENEVTALTELVSEARDVIDLAGKVEGKSAYQVAVDNGFEGTEEEWLESLVGPPGETGSKGDSTTISLRYGISSEPMENTVVVWQDTIPQMSETYPYLWIEISTETQTSKGGSIVIEKGIIGYYSTPDSGGNANLTPELKTALVNYYTHVMPNFDDANGLAYINAILTALGAETRGEQEEPETPDEPDAPEVTLSSISAVYSGGDVAVGTAVTDLTGIVVTAHYSDGSRVTVTGYTLSGTIAEGSNTVTVTYEGLTTTFAVTGVAEEEPEEPSGDVYVYSLELGNAVLIKAGASDAMGGTVGLSGGQATSRRTFLAKTGIEELWCISASSPYGKWEEECYPIPIPADATGLNISVPGYVPGPALYTHADGAFTRTLDAGWQTSGSYSLTFEPGTYQYLSVNTKTTSGGAFSTEPTNYVVEFTK